MATACWAYGSIGTWAGECGNGSFTNIDQNATIEDIPTPYDSTLVVLNNKLNSTYIGYGAGGAQGYYGLVTARRDELDFQQISGPQAHGG